MVYLYGASIKGIQGYIFRSNELKEIIGASEIIKKIESMVKIDKKGICQIEKDYKLSKPPTVLLSAAGNIRLIIDNEKDAKEIVLNFTKDIMQMAYGITVVQALVEMEDSSSSIQEHRTTLEKNLNIQRNKATLPLDMSYTILEKDRKSGRPIYTEEIKGEYRDMSTYQKISAYNAMPEDKKKNVEFSKISNNNSKIAVIHADGNGLGKIVKKLKGDDISLFSEELDKATKAAFKEAVDSFKDIDIKEREVILSGDDMTVVCNATYALEFTQRYLKNFEEKTKGIKEEDNGLTACAGIVYCNEKYPFHYAIALAEELCGYSKQHAKQIDSELAPSCLMFYNAKESGLVNYKKSIKKTIKTIGVSFDFGPYYINDVEYEKKKQPTVNAFLSLYNEMDSVISKYRKDTDKLYKDKVFFERIMSNIDTKFSYDDKTKLDNKLSSLYETLAVGNLKVKKDGIDNKTPLIDILELKNVLGDES